MKNKNNKLSPKTAQFTQLFNCVFECPGAEKMFGGFGGEFICSETKMDRERFRVTRAHGGLHHLLPVKGLCSVYLCTSFELVGVF